jgi:hypothetical protein
MTVEQRGDAGELLESVGDLRQQVRLDRHNYWFPVLLFGVLTLASMAFYFGSTTSSVLNIVCSGGTKASGEHCNAVFPSNALSNGHIIAINGWRVHGSGPMSLTVTGVISRTFQWLAPGFALNNLGSWLTLYWSLALVGGLALTYLFYRRRSSKVGIEVRSLPAVLVSLALLAAALVFGALMMNGVVKPVASTLFASGGDLWMRGTAPVLIVAIALLALALVERSVGYTIYALGFVIVALMSALYDVSNLFDRMGIGAPFDSRLHELPNLILPSAYLLLGGFVMWAVQHDSRRERSSSELAR